MEFNNKILRCSWIVVMVPLLLIIYYYILFIMCLELDNSLKNKSKRKSRVQHLISSVESSGCYKKFVSSKLLKNTPETYKKNYNIHYCIILISITDRTLNNLLWFFRNFLWFTIIMHIYYLLFMAMITTSSVDMYIFEKSLPCALFWGWFAYICWLVFYFLELLVL